MAGNRSSAGSSRSQLDPRTRVGRNMTTRNATYRWAVGVALAAALVLVWLSLGVGIIGRDGDPANLMYFGVLGVGIVGALDRALPFGWDGPRAVRDGARSDGGRRVRGDRGVGLPVERTARACDSERVLRCPVPRIGVAVSSCGTGAIRTGRRIARRGPTAPVSLSASSERRPFLASIASMSRRSTGSTCPRRASTATCGRRGSGRHRSIVGERSIVDVERSRHEL